MKVRRCTSVHLTEKIHGSLCLYRCILYLVEAYGKSLVCYLSWKHFLPELVMGSLQSSRKYMKWPFYPKVTLLPLKEMTLLAAAC